MAEHEPLEVNRREHLDVYQCHECRWVYPEALLAEACEKYDLDPRREVRDRIRGTAPDFTGGTPL